MNRDVSGVDGEKLEFQAGGIRTHKKPLFSTYCYMTDFLGNSFVVDDAIKILGLLR